MPALKTNCPRCGKSYTLPQGEAKLLKCPKCGEKWTLSASGDETRAPRVAAPGSPQEGRVHAGLRIGGFELRRKLGAGAMGEVWLAYDAQLDRQVAIKILPPHFADDQGRRARFLREARLAARLDHPHIATVHQAGVEAGIPFIAMQHIDGNSLDKSVRPGRPMPWRKAAKAISEAAKGLAAAHQLGLVHRDVKPSNLMQTSHGLTKVVDFGLARVMEGETRLTQPGLLLGTPAYMAPELWTGQEASPASDVYGLACTGYFLVTGHDPFDGKNLPALGYQHQQEPFPNPRRVAPEVPDRFCGILAQAAAKDPHQRFQTAAEMATELDALLATPQQSLVFSSPAEDSLPPEAILHEEGRSLRLTTIAAGAAGLLTLVAMAVLLLMRPSMGSLRVNVVQPPADLVVRLDGKAISSDELAEPLSMAVGPHELLLAAQDFEPLSHEFSVVRGFNPALELEMRSSTGSLKVNISQPPADLVVRLDGKVIPTEELAEPLSMAVGPHELLLLAQGFERLSRAFTIARGFNPALELELKPVATKAVLDPQEDKVQLASAAQAVLKQHCYQCHGLAALEEGMHVLKPDELIEKGFVVAGNLEKSRIWQRLGVERTMPPDQRLAPADDQRDVIRRWILAGAPAFAAEAPRSFRTPQDEYADMLRHLRGVPQNQRKFQRYFSLATMHNNHFKTRKGRNNTNLDGADLRLARAALSKLLNSLSRKNSEIIVPQALDAEKTLFQINLRDYDWNSEQWQEVLKIYPHGMKLSEVSDAALRELAREVYSLAGTDVPSVRIDWFVATASRPPLYEKLLQLPAQVIDLERALGVDVEQNFLDDRLQRAGFATSGVSKNNRLVERHALSFGAYWKSYDFASSSGRAELAKRPLGPAFAKNEFTEEAFQADGGEMIFTLPNGLQGYYLADKAGKYLATGPINIVRDLQETAGTPDVVNGLSCMGCHQQGMIRFRDDVREGLGVAAHAKIKVQALFPTQTVMEQSLDKDERRFLAALEQAIGPFLRTGSDASTDIRQFREPISVVAKLFYRDLEIDDVASELGLESPAKLEAAIELGEDLRFGLGLGNLVQGAPIKRDNWSNVGGEKSLFQLASEKLSRGAAVKMAPRVETPILAPDKPDERPTSPPSLKDPPKDLPVPERKRVIPTTPPPPPPQVWDTIKLVNNVGKTMQVKLKAKNADHQLTVSIPPYATREARVNQDYRYHADVALEILSPVIIVGRPKEPDLQPHGWFEIGEIKPKQLDVDKMVQANKSAR